MHEHPWGFLIVLYLFLGGLGAGCLALSGLAWLSRRAELERVGRVGALIAPLPVAFGSLLLIFDLGSPWRFWRLFAHFNPVSPMSIGSWLLLLFTAVAAVWAALQLPAAWIDSVQRRLGRRGAWLAPLRRRNASPAANARVRDAVALAGVLLGLGVGIYTGVLLGAIPARPFWNTPIVAQLFLFSAFSTATALLALAAPLFPALRSSGEGPERRALLRADVAFIVLELFILIPFVVHGELSVLSARASLDMILGGPYTAMFWGGVVGLGILLPLALESAELLGLSRSLPRAAERGLAFVAPVLVLVGGWLVRWVFVYAGQETSFL